MKVDTTIKAIRDLCPCFENRVFGAVELGQLQLNSVNPTNIPAAYVISAREDPQEDQCTANSYYQEIIATIDVIVLVNNTADNRGQNSANTIEEIKSSLFKALLSWSPIDDDNQAIYTYAGCSLRNLTPAVVAYDIEFNTSYVIDIEDTRQQVELNEQTGKFEYADIDVDMIADGQKPDDQIDAKVQIKDLW